MKKYLISTAATALIASSAAAGGLDRSGQPMGFLFDEGDVVTFSFGLVSPSVTGTGFANVGGDYSRLSATYKQQINDQLSLGIIWDQPYGADVVYTESPATTTLGGTSAIVDSSAVTALMRYEFDGGFGVHGGLRAQSVGGDITLNGLAYAAGGAAGYELNLERGTEFGYVGGVSYERPEIALRVALTYNSEINYDLDAFDNFVFALSGGVSGATTVETSSPASYVLEFQTGVAPGTLVFGSIRHAKWGDFDVPAPGLGGVDLADLDDSTNYSLGVGRQFSDKFAGSISFQYEEEGDPAGSPLAPTNGLKGVSIGGRYKMDDQVTLSGGINYTQVGDATPAVGGTPVASFEDNDSFAFGFSIAYSF